MDKATWIASLQAFIVQQRQLAPIPPRTNLTDEEEWHCRIIGGEFIGWCQEGFPHIMRQRQALAQLMDFDPKPYIVFTTSMAGLVAAQEIIPESQGKLLYLLHEEFIEWQKQNSTHEFKWLIHHWSYFQIPDALPLQRANLVHAKIGAHKFRVHICGDFWGEKYGSESEHLWQWMSNRMELLNEENSHISF